jgi:hypothetical protein
MRTTIERKTKILQQKAKKLKGSLKETDAKSLKEKTLKIRGSW